MHTPFCFFMEAEVEGPLSGLLKLQELDTLLDRERAELAGLPAELALVESELASAKSEYSSVEERLTNLSAAQKKCESDKAETRQKLADFRTKLLSLKTNSEYKTMLEQISFVEKRIDDLDSRTLEIMYEEDEARKTIEEARKKLDRYSDRAIRKKVLLAERASTLMTEIDRLQLDRGGMAASIGIRLIRKYDQLRASGKACAVVDLTRGACGGCLTHVPTQHAVEIGQGLSYTCPICGRYIVASNGNQGVMSDIER